MTTTDNSGGDGIPVEEQFTFSVTEPVWFDKDDEIFFEPMRFPPVLQGERFATQGHFDGVLLALYLGTKAKGAFLGSAVIVAPGIAIGAKHVFEEHVQQLILGNSSICGFGLGENCRGDFWDVKHAMIDQTHDVAIFSLISRSAVPTTRKFKLATTSTRLPGVGEPVMIAGFKPCEDSFENPDGLPIRYSGNVVGSIGIVSEHYLNGRDSVMLPWPCFRVEVGSWGAMSGGPVFDTTGSVVGVLCSAMGTDENGYSCVSMLHPALGMPFSPIWPNALYSDSETMMNLNPQFCRIEGRDAVSIGQDDEGRVTWTYRSWT